MTEIHRTTSDPQPDPTPVPDNVDVKMSEDGKEGQAKVRAENADEGARPEWLPEKFDSPEAMAKSYAELEKKFSQGEPAPENEPAPEGTNEDAPNDLTIQKTEKASEAPAEIDFNKYGEEFVKEGALSQDSYDELAAKGIPPAVIDGYLAGQKAVAENAAQELTAVVGSPEQFKAVQEWAGQNLDEAALTAYNNAVNGADWATAKVLLAGMNSQYQNAGGTTEPKLTKGEGTPRQPGVQPFASNAEQSAAINDPRYQTDPAYRREVEKRILAGG